MSLAVLTLFHANGIGWDEIAAVIAIAGLVGLIAYWIDRGGETDDAEDDPESMTDAPG